jgi:hypothetical protein
VRGSLAALATVLLLAAPALAQQQPAAPQPGPPPAAAPGPGQAPGSPGDDPAVQRGTDPPPTAQGTRAPIETDTETQTPELYPLILRIWNEPVDLQGNPVAGGSTGRTGEPSPAAATAEGCGTTGAELAAWPAGSPDPCPTAGDAPAP